LAGKIFWKSYMTLFFEKTYDEIPLKKWCEYQTVSHIHTPASPFVGGME